MAMRGRRDHLRHALFTALGLSPLLGCGGEATRGDNHESGGATSASGGESAASGGATFANGGAISANGGATSANGGATAAGGAEWKGPRCENPVVIDAAGNQVMCEAGWIHRIAPTTCPSNDPNRQWGGGGCTTDADCSGTSVCQCGELKNTCVYANCSGDADCEPGYACASLPDIGCGSSFTCQTAADRCISSRDCVAGMNCVMIGTEFRYCAAAGCGIGRPFLVDCELRRAAVRERSDWGSLHASLGAFEPSASLAEHWTRVAIAEHASVAAFARFTLQLMALGAPAELVLASTEAQRDEIEHARIGFALASAYAGRAIGPGALDVGDCLSQMSLEHCVVTAFREGAVGETAAALEAAEASAVETDARVRAILEKIADDETRHAELAFRFIAWAIQREPRLAATLRNELECPLRSVAFNEITRPCLQALLASNRIEPGSTTARA